VALIGVIGCALPAGDEKVPRWVMVCDPYHLRKLIRNRSAGRQLQPLVTLCLFLLGKGGVVHPHSLVSELALADWLLQVSRTLDDRPAVLLKEYAACHLTCSAGHPELLLLLAPLVTALLSLRLEERLTDREKRLELITFRSCFGLVTMLLKSASPLDFRDSHSSSEGPSTVHLWSNENLEKLLASSSSRALLVASPAACHLGADHAGH
jgi:hypothetical protein